MAKNHSVLHTLGAIRSRMRPDGDGVAAKKSPGAKKGQDVASFMRALKHSRKSEVELVRKVVLGAAAGITEHVKWNAPSFCYRGDDRVTLRLQPGDRVEIVFHCGAKKRVGGTRPNVSDVDGLLKWLAVDRAIVTLSDADDVRAKSGAVEALVREWMEATKD